VPADVIHALNAYKRRHATIHNLMRSMLSHEGWFVPLNWIKRYLPDRKASARLLPLNEEGEWPVDGHLWLFTDEEEAYAASEAGNALGGYSGPLSGNEVFGGLAKGITEVHINPAAPPWRSLVLDEPKLEFVLAWVNAFRLEGVLMTKPAELETWLRKAIYVVPVDPKKRTAHVVRVESMPGNYVAAFTAPDRVHAFIGGLDPEVRAATSVTVLSAPQLFGMASQLPVAGVALNADSPPCIVFPPARCRELATPLTTKEPEAQGVRG
jgi:hypothetical protein